MKRQGREIEEAKRTISDSPTKGTQKLHPYLYHSPVKDAQDFAWLFWPISSSEYSFKDKIFIYFSASSGLYVNITFST